jgi:hypothetical protein
VIGDVVRRKMSSGSLYRRTVGCIGGNVSVKSLGTSRHGLTAKATCGNRPANAVRRRDRPAVRETPRGTGQRAHERHEQDPKARCTDRGTPACFGVRVRWLRPRADLARVGVPGKFKYGLAYFDQHLLQNFKPKCPKRLIGKL